MMEGWLFPLFLLLSNSILRRPLFIISQFILSRSRMDFRSFEVQAGVITHASGSARLRLAKTEVLATVNFQLGEPPVDRPNEGIVTCSVECCPTASLSFEGNGAQDLNFMLSAHLERIVTASKCVDRKALSIIPGKQCWVVHIDALVGLQLQNPFAYSFNSPVNR